MTRFLLPLLSAVALVAATAPRPWTAVATPVASGSYLIGNPKARVKLVEYVSYTCPHCAHFEKEADATLDAMVRSGSTSVEIRNQVHDGIDLAAATLARCAGAAAFPKVHAAFFARQEQWYERAAEWAEGNRERVKSWPQLAQLSAVAEGAGLPAIAREAGAPAAAILEPVMPGVLGALPSVMVFQDKPSRRSPKSSEACRSNATTSESRTTCPVASRRAESRGF